MKSETRGGTVLKSCKVLRSEADTAVWQASVSITDLLLPLYGHAICQSMQEGGKSVCSKSGAEKMTLRSRDGCLSRSERLEW